MKPSTVVRSSSAGASVCANVIEPPGARASAPPRIGNRRDTCELSTRVSASAEGEERPAAEEPQVQTISALLCLHHLVGKGLDLVPVSFGELARAVFRQVDDRGRRSSALLEADGARRVLLCRAPTLRGRLRHQLRRLR